MSKQPGVKAVVFCQQQQQSGQLEDPGSGQAVRVVHQVHEGIVLVVELLCPSSVCCWLVRWELQCMLFQWWLFLCRHTLAVVFAAVGAISSGCHPGCGGRVDVGDSAVIVSAGGGRA